MKKRLSGLESGERGVITRVEGTGFVRRMLDMGLAEGTEITVVRRTPLGDASKDYGHEN